MFRPSLPPFTRQTALEKVRLVEDDWNRRDPATAADAYSQNSHWKDQRKDRAEVVIGRLAIKAFLTEKWAQELEYRLVKALWAFDDRRIAVQSIYEYRNCKHRWFRGYGIEHWEFDDVGLIQYHHSSLNECSIAEGDRKFHWRLGRRPGDSPELSDFGF